MSFHPPCIRKLLKDVLPQNEDIHHERDRSRKWESDKERLRSHCVAGVITPMITSVGRAGERMAQ